MKGISAVIITLNEEKNIERCLRSLDGVVDEVILFDSQSTDRTVEIAEQFNTIIFQCKWKGYAQTKNEANEKAVYDYILWLDADEALSEELSASLEHIKGSLSGAYRIARRNNYCGKWLMHGGYYPDQKVRLFPKGKATWKGDFVHEWLDVNASVSITDLEGDILHYSYYNTEEHLKRSQKYAVLGAAQAKGNSKFKNLLKLIFSPPFKFFKSYFLLLGFLDGKAGLYCTAISSWEVFKKYRLALFN